MQNVSNSLAVLATVSSRESDRRLAQAVLALSILGFCLLAPFARVPLLPVPAFVPAYQSALVITDIITCTLLFGQFRLLRAPSLFVLACGYLFAAGIAIVHMLTFPGAFAPGGLLGAGPQSTAWLYVVWHGGFPLFVIAYALLKDRRWTGHPGLLIAGGVAAVAALVAAGSWVGLSAASFLPALMDGNRFGPYLWIFITLVWLAVVVALLVLHRRGNSLLDLWLQVVMCAWLFDVGLSALLNGARFDLGFYAGRAYGFLASAFVLVMLLLENNLLYTRLAEAHGDLEESNRRLAEASRLKSEFLANMSHELRTPLNAIIGFTGTLLMKLAGPLTPAQERQLTTIESSGRHLLSLINDMLDIAKIEAGKTEIRLEPIEAGAVIAEVADALRPQALAKGIDLALNLHAAPLQALADRRALQQILLNLVTNAIKFTDAGGIDIRLEPASLEGKPGVAISVRDTGIGIRAEDQARLFQIFTQLDASSTRRHEGTGLGLHLSRRLAGLLGGTLCFTSEYGVGSTFTLVLEAAAPGGQV